MFDISSFLEISWLRKLNVHCLNHSAVPPPLLSSFIVHGVYGQQSAVVPTALGDQRGTKGDLTI